MSQRETGEPFAADHSEGLLLLRWRAGVLKVFRVRDLADAARRKAGAFQ